MCQARGRRCTAFSTPYVCDTISYVCILHIRTRAYSHITPSLLLSLPPQPQSPLFPYTTLSDLGRGPRTGGGGGTKPPPPLCPCRPLSPRPWRRRDLRPA